MSIENGSTLPWSPDEDKLIVQLWEAGQPASRISTKVPGRSRNAVMGRLHRLGKIDKSRVPVRYSDEPKRVKPAYKPVATRQPGMPAIRGSVAPKPMSRPVVTVEPPVEGRMVLADLHQMSCRYIHGDPKHEDHRYCGAKSERPYGYCDYHHGVVYTGLVKNAQRVGEMKLQHRGVAR